MNDASISVVIDFRDGRERITRVVPVDGDAWREATSPVELSHDPLSMLLASPGMHGGCGNAYTVRKKAFTIRKVLAYDIARALTKVLTDEFGARDEVDGWGKHDLTPEELRHRDYVGGPRG